MSFSRPYKKYPISSRLIGTLKNGGVTIYTMKNVHQALELYVFRQVDLSIIRVAPDIIQETQDVILDFEGYDFLKAVHYCSTSSFEKWFILETLKRLYETIEIDDIHHYLYHLICNVIMNHTQTWICMDDSLLYDFMFVYVMLDQKIPLSATLWKRTFTKHPSYDKIKNRLFLTHGNKINPRFIEE